VAPTAPPQPDSPYTSRGRHHTTPHRTAPHSTAQHLRRGNVGDHLTFLPAQIEQHLAVLEHVLLTHNTCPVQSTRVRASAGAHSCCRRTCAHRRRGSRGMSLAGPTAASSRVGGGGATPPVGKRAGSGKRCVRVTIVFPVAATNLQHSKLPVGGFLPRLHLLQLLLTSPRRGLHLHTTHGTEYETQSAHIAHTRRGTEHAAQRTAQHAAQMRTAHL
jgi:hypothetical protein